MKKLINIDAFLSTLLVFVSMLIFPLIFSLSFFDPFEKALADFEITDVGFTELHEQKNIKSDSNIVIVNIKDMKASHLIILFDVLSDIKPKVIGVEDLLNLNKLSEEQKDILADKFAGSNIIYGYYKNANDKQIDLLKNKNNELAYLDIFFDKDREFFTAREFYPSINSKDNKKYSFALSIVNKFDKNKSERLLQRDKKSERIYYKGNLEKFYWTHGFDVIDQLEDHQYLKSKIVLLGEFTPDKEPYVINKGYFTPLNEDNVGRTFTDMYPIVLQANIISMILNDNYYNSLPGWIAAIVAFILTYMNMMIFRRININHKQWYEITSVLIFLIESIIILFLTVILFHEYNFELNLTLAIFALALSIFLYEGYQESVKPLTLRAFNYIFNR
jgi:CHASE2 domain-containing sensor protein